MMNRDARHDGPRRYGPDAIRRMEVLDVAKSAGFSVDDARVLLQTAEAGTPAFQALRELAARKLPEVDALITRAAATRDWLILATGLLMSSLDVCALFEPGREHAPQSSSPEPLRIMHVGSAFTPA